MFEDILQGLIKQAGQSAIVENNEVPNEHKVELEVYLDFWVIHQTLSKAVA
jgi:hypothetical protein